MGKERGIRKEGARDGSDGEEWSRTQLEVRQGYLKGREARKPGDRAHNEWKVGQCRPERLESSTSGRDNCARGRRPRARACPPARLVMSLDATDIFGGKWCCVGQWWQRLIGWHLLTSAAVISWGRPSRVA